ncbi:MAG: 2-phosphosulfolactate phosphatase [Bacteroidales bacterium]|nr:2-phosphosulfolactate phosphatase [Bacteroidales bacterium]
MAGKKQLEVCFSPSLLDNHPDRSAVVVIIDIFRATSSICTAFANGVTAIIPVAETSEAQAYKSKGYLVAGERDGIILDFADFGNSPDNFGREQIAGKTVVYTTTNGTRTIHLASVYRKTVIGSFLNARAVIDYLLAEGRNVLLLCAGWKGRFNLEDTVCAGYIASQLLESGQFETICDSTLASVDLWKTAENDLRGYIEKAAHRHRLKTKNLDGCIDHCLTFNLTGIVPVLLDGILVTAPSGKK